MKIYSYIKSRARSSQRFFSAKTLYPAWGVFLEAAGWQ